MDSYICIARYLWGSWASSLTRLPCNRRQTTQERNTQTHFCSRDLDLDPIALIYEVELDIRKMYLCTKHESNSEEYTSLVHFSLSLFLFHLCVQFCSYLCIILFCLLHVLILCIVYLCRPVLCILRSSLSLLYCNKCVLTRVDHVTKSMHNISHIVSYHNLACPKMVPLSAWPCSFNDTVFR